MPELVIPGTEPVKKVIDRIQARKNRRIDSFVNSADELQFQMRVAGVGYPADTLTMTIDGLEMPLTEGAIKTTALLINQSKPSWFQRFSDPQFFPKLFRNYQHKRGFLVRHDGFQVYAVLPDTYQIADAYELLEQNFLPSLEEHFGNVRGIEHIIGGDDDGDLESFRVICGDNLVPVEDKMGQYLMFMLSTSDNGLADTRCWIGLYRPISQSVAVRKQTSANWSHRTDSTEFFGKAGDRVRDTGYYKKAFQAHFSEMVNEPLQMRDDDSGILMSCADLVELLKKMKLIGSGHYKAARLYANSLTEDGRPRNTLYDCFNCLAIGAKDLTNLAQRQKAEESTMTLFTSKGGISEQIRRAYERF